MSDDKVVSLGAKKKAITDEKQQDENKVCEPV